MPKVEAFPNLSGPSRLDWLVLDLLLPTRPHPLSAHRTVANLTRLGQDLVADIAVVALAAMLDVTVGSVSSTEQAMQRVVLDPFSRGPAVTFLTQASELSHVAAHPIPTIKAPLPCFTDVCAVSEHNVFTTTNELKGKGYHKDQSGLSTTGDYSVRMSSMCL